MRIIKHKKCFYDKWRRWYHLSTNFNHRLIRIVPWDKDFSRCPTEPPGKRICVAPTIEQCLTALPYCEGSEYTVYRTVKRLKAMKPVNVFDSKVTQEGWLQKPTEFIKLGRIFVGDVNAHNEDRQFIIEQAASTDSLLKSRKVLHWWKKINVRRYMK